jgi:mono/diheme cytochrome c family protein
MSPTEAEASRDRSGSEVVVARVDGRRLVFAADADTASVAAIDPDRRRELGRTPVGGAPSQMLIGRDGRLYVALRDRSSVAVLEATGSPDGSLRERATIATAAEPVALAMTKGGAALLVASGWGGKLEGFRIGGRSRLFEVSLPREPRAIALSEDSATAFVSHMVGGVVSAVSLGAFGGDGAAPDSASSPVRVASISVRGGDFIPPPMFDCGPSVAPPGPPTARAANQGYALARYEGRVFAPQVLVRTGDPRARSDGYGSTASDLPSHVSSVAVIDEARRKVALASVNLPATGVGAYVRRHRDCLLPRAAAADPLRGSIFVACADTGVVLELDAGAPDPARAVKRRFPAAPGSTGIALDAGEREAFVWSSLTRSLDILALGEPTKRRMRGERGRRSASVLLEEVERPPEDGQLGAGRLLFHTSGDRRIAADGRACASCHPDGRDDGLTWSTPEGPRQPPMLAGRVEGTAPYSWDGGHATVEEHLAITLKRLHGKGLDGDSMRAIAAYVRAIPGPPRAEAELTPTAARGRDLFRSVEVGCTNCHREEAMFADGSQHDVSSSAPADRSSVFDTPSLRFVGGTAPYFHDGRYATLRELLAGTRKTMGMTEHLNEADLTAIESYLLSL